MGSPLGGSAGLGATILAELNVNGQTQFVGNVTSDAVQILALINAAGLELMREFDWQALQTEYRFNTNFVTTTGNLTLGSAAITGIPSTVGIAAGTWGVVTGPGVSQDAFVLSVDSANQITMSQPATLNVTGHALTFAQFKYPFPADFDRITNRTQWDKTKHWEMLGGETPQQWQWLKSGYISTGPRVRWRQYGRAFQIWPWMGTSEYLGWEYISNSWVNSGVVTTLGNGQSAFLNDQDTCIFDDRLIITKTKLKYWEVKGFDTTAFARDYERLRDIAKGIDSGSTTLSMAPNASQVLVGIQNIPDTGYGT